MGKRNLVFIMSDQQRYDTMSCYGNDWIQTPNLEQIQFAQPGAAGQRCGGTQVSEALKFLDVGRAHVTSRRRADDDGRILDQRVEVLAHGRDALGLGGC